MSNNTKEKIIKEISKNSVEKVLISLKEYRDLNLIDIRTYYENQKGEWNPTRKGVSINADKYPELKAGILELEKAIQDF